MNHAQRRAGEWLVWSLTVCATLAPFDMSIRGAATRVGVGWPGDADAWSALGLHLIAFLITGVLGTPALAAGGGTRRHTAGRVARAFLICLALEAGQTLVASRHAELIDLVVNTIGLALGMTLHSRSKDWFCARASAMTDVDGAVSWRRIAGLFAWAVVWSSLIIGHRYTLALSSWNSSYPLHASCGGDLDGTKPWPVYASLYEQDLSAQEIAALLSAPPFGSQGGPSTAEEVAPSRKGRSSDRYRLDRIIDEIRSNDRFTLELACTGKARHATATLGASEWRANVVVAAEPRGVYAGIRSPLAGPNGARLPLRVPLEAREGVHVIVAYARGLVTIARAGVAQAAVLDLREPSVIVGSGHGRVGRASTGFIAALSFLLVAGRGRRPRMAEILKYAALAYALLTPVFIVAAMEQVPPLGIYMWLGPGLVVATLLIPASDSTNHGT